jgi:hypothetical protein
MPQYTREDLEQLARLKGEGGSPETSQDVSRIGTSHRPSPAPFRRDVRREIWDTVYAAGQPISLMDICKRLKVKKAPWMKAHVESLVRDGYLIRTQGEYKTGALMYFYEVKS